MLLSRHRMVTGNIWPQSSQLAELLWTDPGIKSEISASKLTSTSKKKKKKAQAENECSNILPKSLPVRKKPPPHVVAIVTVSDCENVHT